MSHILLKQVDKAEEWGLIDYQLIARRTNSFIIQEKRSKPLTDQCSFPWPLATIDSDEERRCPWAFILPSLLMELQTLQDEWYAVGWLVVFYFRHDYGFVFLRTVEASSKDRDRRAELQARVWYHRNYHHVYFQPSLGVTHDGVDITREARTGTHDSRTVIQDSTS